MNSPKFTNGHTYGRHKKAEWGTFIKVCFNTTNYQKIKGMFHDNKLMNSIRTHKNPKGYPTN